MAAVVSTPMNAHRGCRGVAVALGRINTSTMLPQRTIVWVEVTNVVAVEGIVVHCEGKQPPP